MGVSRRRRLAPASNGPVPLLSAPLPSLVRDAFPCARRRCPTTLQRLQQPRRTQERPTPGEKNDECGPGHLHGEPSEGRVALAGVSTPDSAALVNSDGGRGIRCEWCGLATYACGRNCARNRYALVRVLPHVHRLPRCPRAQCL